MKNGKCPNFCSYFQLWWLVASEPLHREFINIIFLIGKPKPSSVQLKNVRCGCNTKQPCALEWNSNSFQSTGHKSVNFPATVFFFWIWIAERMGKKHLWIPNGSREIEQKPSKNKSSKPTVQSDLLQALYYETLACLKWFEVNVYTSNVFALPCETLKLPLQ